MDEKAQNVLPRGWAESSIGDITLPVQKIDPLDDPEREIEYIDISSIDNVRNIVGEPKHFRFKDAPSRARQIIRTGDVLFATVRPYLRNIAAVPPRYDGQIASTGFSVLRPASGIEPTFLFYKSTSTDFVNALSVEQYGVSYPAVTDDQVREQSILVPPHNEQRRIAAKIDALFSELDNGVDCLKTAREQLKAYRQAVLKYAFEGKLTIQWRHDNKGLLESAAQFLSRVARDSEARYQKELEEWKVATRNRVGVLRSAKKPKMPKRPSPGALIRERGGEQLPELPLGWNWVALTFLLTTEKKPMTTGPFGTMLKKSEHQSAGVAVLGIENIGEAKFLAGNKIFVTEAKANELHAFEVEAGDIIISRSGTVGEICEVPDDLGRALISTNLLRVSINPKVVRSQFFVFLFQGCSAVKTQVKDLCKGSSRDFLNQSILSAIAFPLPSLAEQDEVLRQIDTEISRIERLGDEIETNLFKANSLRHCILKKALSGELVAQDANDEPASLLLERIAAESGAMDNGKKKIRKTGAA